MKSENEAMDLKSYKYHNNQAKNDAASRQLPIYANRKYVIRSPGRSIILYSSSSPPIYLSFCRSMTAAAAEEEKLPILSNQPSTTYRSNQPRSPPDLNNTTQPSMDDNIQYSDLQLHEEEERHQGEELADEKSVSSLSSAAGVHQQQKQQEEDTEDSATSLRDNSTTNYCINRATIMTMMTACNNNPIINRLLSQTVLADKLTQYPILHLISIHGKYVALAIIALYLLILLLFWIPGYILSHYFITELGVYLLSVTCVVYGGRCLLRLLAFPGTNVRVYGEIEVEFARYSCKMLDGAVDSLDDFIRCLLFSCGSGGGDGGSGSSSSKKSARILGNSDSCWTTSDIPTTYKRLKIYRDRVLGVYWQVLYCLFEEKGQGYSVTNTAAISTSSPLKRTNFYRGCCENRDSGSESELGGMDSSSEGRGSAATLEVNTDAANIDNTTNNQNTPYGNNPLQGDIGNMTNLTPKARSDGRLLLNMLTSILDDLSTLESSLSNNILRNIENNNTAALKTASISEETYDVATKLLDQLVEFKKLIKSMRPPKVSKSPFPSSAHEEEEDDDNDDDNESDTYDDEDSDVGAEAVRHHLEEQAASSSPTPIGMVRSSIQAFLDMLDPKPHKYIFGLDCIRGCVLARYRGARQFWVKRSGSNLCGGNGKLDVIVIPSLVNDHSDSNSSSSRQHQQQIQLPLSPRDGRSPLNSNTAAQTNGRKAVLYCNPNAGLSEVATGMGLTSGNVDGTGNNQNDSRSWTEYYTEHGYDVYLFNYAGYGRSYGGSSWNESSEFATGFFNAMKRILFSTFIGFTPSSETLKADATDVAKFILNDIGVEQLIIHGESIGGMAAAGAASALTAGPIPTGNVSLLFCDRTFCNLNATAQRLVGGWTGNAIKLLTPTWSTDVAHDFLAAKCAKVVANDAADEIIHDHSSLKSGISFAKELMRGSTTHVGWMINPPLQYRMADLTSQSLPAKNPPKWPEDKHVSFDEAFHFAACARRIGKLATAAKKQAAEEENSVDEEGIELSYLSDESSTRSAKSTTRRVRKQTNNSPPNSLPLIQMWTKLSCCDGLCGAPLGVSVKEGMDVTISWLTSVLIFGSHILAENAEKRSKKIATDLSSETFQIEDFDSRPDDHDQYTLVTHAIPIPEVLSALKNMTSECTIPEVENEIEYVIGCLAYVVSRLTSKENGVTSTKRRYEADNNEDFPVGCFLNLHCGHNNQYSTEERDQLMSIIRRCCGDTV